MAANQSYPQSFLARYSDCILCLPSGFSPYLRGTPYRSDRSSHSPRIRRTLRSPASHSSLSAPRETMSGRKLPASANLFAVPSAGCRRDRVHRRLGLGYRTYIEAAGISLGFLGTFGGRSQTLLGGFWCHRKHLA